MGSSLENPYILAADIINPNPTDPCFKISASGVVIRNPGGHTITGNFEIMAGSGWSGMNDNNGWPGIQTFTFDDGSYGQNGTVHGYATFNGNSTNNGSIYGTVIFNQTSYNWGTIYPTTPVNFNDTSENAYTGYVYGDANFNCNSANNNPGGVTGLSLIHISEPTRPY